jgi:hypothetical protein
MSKEIQKKLITEIMNEDAKDGLYKKQSSIDWLIEQWPILESQLPSKLIEQARQMHRDEIENAYDKGNVDGRGVLWDEEFISGYDYYNKIYGQ